VTATIVPASQQAGRALAAMVNELEIRYTGGTRFFDALDERLREPFWFNAVLDKAHSLYGSQYGIAVSGEFGKRFRRWLSEDHLAYGASSHGVPIVFPGDLRHATLTDDFIRNLDIDNGEQFVFVDDSYYKGRTYRQVKAAIEKRGGACDYIVVLYDGSTTPAIVPSLFRYHEPHSTRIRV
jgi:hypothetical protein